MSIRQIIAIGLFLCIWGQAHAAINAHLSRTSVVLGSTVNLVIKATEGDEIGQPDFSPLQQHFRVIGQSSSSHFSFVNGHSSSSKTLTVRLYPKAPGTFTIPSLSTSSGNTPALSLTVTSQPTTNAAAASRHFFVLTSVSPNPLYVGQQAMVTVKLFYDGRLRSGNITPLQLKGASVQPLGDAKKYQATRNGKRYNVYEKRYAIFPSQPGELTIPAMVFQGKVQVPGRQQRQFSFFNMPFSVGFGRTKPVTAASQPVSVTVKPKPAGWQGKWLPASKLTLRLSGVPDTKTLQMGTPINLTLSLSAQGLSPTALPTLSLPDMPNAAVYGDKPNTHSSHKNGIVQSSKTRSFAVLPKHPGKLVLPATRLDWFNTRTGKKETITLPSYTFQVMPAGNTATGSGITSRPINNAANSAADQVTVPATNINQTPTWLNWRNAFFASLILWVLLVLGLLINRFRQPRHTSPSSAAPSRRKAPPAGRKQFLQHLKQKDDVLLDSLLAWAQRENAKISTLAVLKQQLDPEQTRLVEQLEAWRYGRGGFPDQANTAFRSGLKWRSANGVQAKESTLFPSLYPDKKAEQDD